MIVHQEKKLVRKQNMKLETEPQTVSHTAMEKVQEEIKNPSQII